MRHQPLAAPSAFDTGAYAPEHRLADNWVDHVKAYAAKHGIKYGEALKLASPSWHSQKGGNRYGKRSPKRYMKY